jgi:hypothetical protein
MRRRSRAIGKPHHSRDDIPRRLVVQLVLSSAAGGLTFGTLSKALAADKMTRERAEYQDTPKGISMCATCTLFEPPKSCKVVEGEVSPDGWCKAFALAD